MMGSFKQLSLILEFEGNEKEAKDTLAKLSRIAKKLELKAPTPNDLNWRSKTKGLNCYVWAFQGDIRKIISFLQSVDRIEIKARIGQKTTS